MSVILCQHVRSWNRIPLSPTSKLQQQQNFSNMGNEKAGLLTAGHVAQGESHDREGNIFSHQI